MNYSKHGKRITNKQFDDKLTENNEFIIRIDNYINSKTPINFKCVLCDKIYKQEPKKIYHFKCKCFERDLSYRERLIRLSKNITPIEHYVNMRTKISHKCLDCGNIFQTTPKSIISSKIGCPSCSGKLFNKDKYISLLPPNLILLEDYDGSNKYHKHKCLDCDNEFKTKPNYILHMKTNCPYCSRSKGERFIHDYLTSNNITFKQEYTVNIDSKNHRFDFKLENNTFIEYDGIQHFKSIDFFGGDEYLEEVNKNDQIKNNWIKENNYTLLRISYKDNIKDKLDKWLK